MQALIVAEQIENLEELCGRSAENDDARTILVPARGVVCFSARTNLKQTLSSLSNTDSAQVSRKLSGQPAAPQ